MNPEEKQPTATASSPTANEQITNAVTQSNVKVVAEAPAIALGNVYQTAVHSTEIMFENAVNAQNQQNILQQGATNQVVTPVRKVDTITDLIAISNTIKH